MTSQPPAAVAAQTAHVERILSAPRARVFEAWTTADQIAEWYGPAHAELPRDGIRIDLRAGGRWEVTMVLPGGRRYVAGYAIVELVKPELLVLRSDPMPDVGMPDGTVVRVQFHDLGDRTRVTVSEGPFTPPGHEHAAAGYAAALDKLAVFLSLRPE